MTSAGMPRRLHWCAAQMLWGYMRVWMTAKSMSCAHSASAGAKGFSTGKRPPMTGQDGRRKISMPSASVCRAGRPGSAAVTTSAL